MKAGMVMEPEDLAAFGSFPSSSPATTTSYDSRGNTYVDIR
jgi:hypothetical protein